MGTVGFSFSDTIAGYVVSFDKSADTFELKRSDGQIAKIKFAAGTYAWIANNLGQPRQWCGDRMRDMLIPGRYLFVYGIYYPEHGRAYFRGPIYRLCRPPEADGYDFERQDWWINQIGELGDFYLKAQFAGQDQLITITTAQRFRLSWSKANGSITARKPTPSPAWSMALPRLT